MVSPNATAEQSSSVPASRSVSCKETGKQPLPVRALIDRHNYHLS
jgi:hypothetical protein